MLPLWMAREVGIQAESLDDLRHDLPERARAEGNRLALPVMAGYFAMLTAQRRGTIVARMPNLDPIITTLRTSVDIAELIAESVDLDVDGDVLRGRCDAHRDDAVGLYVDRTLGFYYCFSCGRRGDVVRWMRETKRCNQETAIALLWERAGHATRPPEDPSTRG